MPARRSTSSSSSARPSGFAPPSDVASYKDLLLFEERLKQNAALLRSRKRKYEVFLAILVIVIIVLTHKSFLRPSSTPWVHYLHLSLLPVAVVTLLLFFASGMYAERIGYANRYVPHANRALRSLNMHLNMRVQPTPLIPFVPFPFSLLLPSAPTPPSGIPRSSPSPSPPPTSSSPQPPTAASLKPTKSTAPAGAPSPLTLRASIPPTKNPRGELIFSSRVDRAFRDGYERYRGMFERRREERYRETRASQGGLMGIWWRLLGYRKKVVPGPGEAGGVTGGGAGSRLGLGRGNSRDGTPPTSAKHSRTPSPSGLAVGPGGGSASSTSSSVGRGSTRRRPGLQQKSSSQGSGTALSSVFNAPRSIPETEVVLDVGQVGERLTKIQDGTDALGGNRARAESFSFLLNGSSSGGASPGRSGIVYTPP